jgi:hypothetical protein
MAVYLKDAMKLQVPQVYPMQSRMIPEKYGTASSHKAGSCLATVPPGTAGLSSNLDDDRHDGPSSRGTRCSSRERNLPDQHKGRDRGAIDLFVGLKIPATVVRLD